jgi:hypothetical protein
LNAQPNPSCDTASHPWRDQRWQLTTPGESSTIPLSAMHAREVFRVTDQPLSRGMRNTKPLRHGLAAVILAIPVIWWSVWYFSDDQCLKRCTDDTVKSVQSGQMTTQQVLNGANDSDVMFTPDELQLLGGLIAASQNYCKHQLGIQ